MILLFCYFEMILLRSRKRLYSFTRNSCHWCLILQTCRQNFLPSLWLQCLIVPHSWEDKNIRASINTKEMHSFLFTPIVSIAIFFKAETTNLNFESFFSHHPFAAQVSIPMSIPFQHPFQCIYLSLISTPQYFCSRKSLRKREQGFWQKYGLTPSKTWLLRAESIFPPTIILYSMPIPMYDLK